jgi:hypothetical protein
LRRILEERFGDLVTSPPLEVALSRPCGAALGAKRVFELMVATRVATQILKCGRRVVGRKCVDADNPLFGVELEAGS